MQYWLGHKVSLITSKAQIKERRFDNYIYIVSFVHLDQVPQIRFLAIKIFNLLLLSR